MVRNSTRLTFIPLLGLCLLQFSAEVKSTQFNCVGTCYKGSFSPKQHKHLNHALVGHSYKNFTDITQQQCLSSCISDCRCLTFQMQDSFCQLLEDDRSTAAEDFQSMQGYSYYDLNQEFIQRDVNNCLNGCCWSNPCLHGGTCTELCHEVKTKFGCTCPADFSGRVCEHFTGKYQSCFHIRTVNPFALNGEYTIDDSLGNSFLVYCDMNAHDDIVWTLIESFDKRNNDAFAQMDFKSNFPRNESTPNWSNFRLAKSTMQFIKQGSTHYRATCNFEKTSYDPGFDYLRGRLATYDFLVDNGTNDCKLYESVIVAGIGCHDCTAETWHGRYHYHLEDDSCDLEAEFGGDVNPFREYFGYYESHINSNHSCFKFPNSTTQWWFGSAM